MLVVGSRMAGVPVTVVIPEDILAVFIPSVIGVESGSSLLTPAHGPNLKVLGHVDHYVPVTKDIPGNLASFRGLFDLKTVMNYEWVIMHHSPHDEEIVPQIVPSVFVGHSLVHATFRRQRSI